MHYIAPNFLDCNQSVEIAVPAFIFFFAEVSDSGLVRYIAPVFLACNRAVENVVPHKAEGSHSGLVRHLGKVVR